MSRWPDFIIVGAMKCATSTLHEQLARQPGLFMSQPKEPNFFSNEEVYGRGTRWYQSLFEAAPPLAQCGESSTHYTKLPTYPRTIDRMSKHLPAHVRFVYVMRHPIDRLVSQYVHEWSQRQVDGPIGQAIKAFPEMVAYSRYAMQIEPYLDAFGAERVLPVFFERLTAEPQAELRRVCAFIGLEGIPQWDHDLSERNVSSERLRTSAWRDALVNLPGARALRRTLIPKSVRDQVKGLWTMKSRPELSPDRLRELSAVFDDDLKRLGRWLELDLTCERFKAIATGTAPQWKRAERVHVR